MLPEWGGLTRIRKNVAIYFKERLFPLGAGLSRLSGIIYYCSA
jgi:hypothetical protein